MKTPFYHYLIGQNGPDELIFPIKSQILEAPSPFFDFLNHPIAIEEKNSGFIENLDEIEGLIKEWESQKELKNQKDFKRKREVFSIKSSDSESNLLKSGLAPRKAFKNL